MAKILKHNYHPPYPAGEEMLGNLIPASFKDREKTSQLKNTLKNVIELSGLSKKEVASCLGLSPSKLSDLLNPFENKVPELYQAAKVIELAEYQPAKLQTELCKAKKIIQEVFQLELFQPEYFVRKK